MNSIIGEMDLTKYFILLIFPFFLLYIFKFFLNQSFVRKSYKRRVLYTTAF